MKNKKQPILDIDLEFEDISFNEHEIKRYTAMKRVNSQKGPEVHKKKSHTLKKKYEDTDFADRHKQLMKDVAKTTEWKEAHEEGLKTRVTNGWEEKNNKGAIKRRKRIQTPYGIFNSKLEAVQWMKDHGIPGALSRVSRGLDSNPTEYYYIKE
jgi:hypothetical protein